MNTLTPSQQSLRRDESAIKRELEQVGSGTVFKGRSCCCPFHGEKHPSAGIKLWGDGAWRFKCQVPTCGVGGDVFDIRAKRRGITLDEALREVGEKDRDRPASPRKPSPVPPAEKVKRVYGTLAELAESACFAVDSSREVTGTKLDPDYKPFVYSDPITRRADLVVLRMLLPNGDKTFLQATARDSGFVFGAPDGLLPIYNRTRITAAPVVVIVEGEKCVHALADIGTVATTSPGGAGKAGKADWAPLAGKTCVLWPDNDPLNDKGLSIGIEHMREVAAILDKLNPPTRVLIVDHQDLGLPPKGDVADFLDDFEGDSPEQLRALIQHVIDSASPTGPAAELKLLIEDTISGKRSAVPWPWKSLSRFSNALIPGAVTCVGGDPSCGKSFLIIESIGYWIEKGFSPAVFMLEDPIEHHLNRVLAQREELSELTDPAWIKANAERTRKSFSDHIEMIEAVGRCITVAPDDEVPILKVAAWVREKATAGHRVIVVDPVTAAGVSDKPWLDDKRFVIEVKAIARRFNCSVILVTHPKKGKKSGGGILDDMAGGAAYPRFCQNVFWITRHEQPQRVLIAAEPCDFYTTINRTIKIAKARNGRGTGVAIGFDFQGSTLRFAEQGPIINEDAASPAEDSRERPMSWEQAKKAASLFAKHYPGKVTQEMGKTLAKDLMKFSWSVATAAIDEHAKVSVVPDLPALLISLQITCSTDQHRKTGATGIVGPLYRVFEE